MKICIAGKNDIAVEGVEFLLHSLGMCKDDILICLNKTDLGIDGFQRSFNKFSKDQGLNIVELDQVFDIPELIFISLEYDRIIPVHRFSSPELYNIHFSLLPKYKGMYTSVWPILNGDKTSGVSLHKIDLGIDTGDLIDQIEFPIDDSDSCRDLYFKYLSFGSLLFKNNIKKLLGRDVLYEKQSVDGASYYAKDSIDFSNLMINLNKTAFEIKSQLRAFYFPEFQTPTIYGQEIIFSEILDTRSSLRAGGVFFECEQYMDISTIDYNLRLYKSLNEIK